MAQVGRISGPLLTANLLRDGVDLAFENDLIYLNVGSDKRVGIVNTALTHDLHIAQDARTTNLIVDTKISADDVEITASSTTINSVIGNLNFTASELVHLNNLRTPLLNIDNNVISTVVSNSNIELRPTSSGTLNVYNDTNIYGSLYTQNDITLGGNLYVGTDPADIVVFVAEVESDVVPDINSTYSLGNRDRYWEGIYSDLFNGQQITIGGLDTPEEINLALRPGKSWFVATNGSDTNQGNHENGPFATIAHALSVATAGDSVYVYPGTYDEVLPLVIPSGVTVTGTDIRTCIIVPDTSSTHSDVFLVNGETTIANLTIKDFFYDSLANTGYAFRFSPGAEVVSRSPYIQNVTVSTKGSLLTTDDPLGFDQGDAGKGAYIDGSVINSNSKEASMLFHSCTFITPGVDAITMTNGVRVEWLNGFTYFSNRGLYATNGTAGFANQGTRFGAEIRSIGSASVYGNYGAVADGSSTLMYLIMHNFAYIGTGKDSSNDNTLHIEENNSVELNSGRIVYQSTDQKGKFKIGDAFYVDFETGTTSINVSGADIVGLSSIQIGTGSNVTFVDSTKMDVGNITIRGNDLLSKTGPINVLAASNEINLDLNVQIHKNLSLVGNLWLGGNLTFGNSPTDTIVFNAPIEDSVIPKTNIAFSLGSATRIWRNLWTKNSYFDSVKIYDNIVTSNILNTDLDLKASGNGLIYIPYNNTELGAGLSVLATTEIKSVSITDPLMLIVGNYAQTGSAVRTGNTSITGNISVTNYSDFSVQFQDIKIDNNIVTTTTSNSDLEFSAAGAGIIKVPTNDVKINNSLSAGSVGTSTLNLSQRLTSGEFSTGNVYINSNYITTVSNSDLLLRANAAGTIYFPSNNVEFDKNLTISLGSSTVKNVSIQGNSTHTGVFQQIGSVNRTGNTEITGTLTTSSFAQFQDIRFTNNAFTTTLSNSNLELYANGSGIVKVPNNSVYIVNDLNVNGSISSSSTSFTGLVTANQFTTGNILIDDNFITTTVAPYDLVLLANNTGKILISSNNVSLAQDLTVTTTVTTTALKNLTITGDLTHNGLFTGTGNRLQTGNLNLTGNLSVSNNANFKNIDFINNVVRTSDSNSDLELKATGTGIIRIPNDNVYLGQRFTILGTSTTASINSSGTVSADQFRTGDVVINDNFITTTVGNNNLILTGQNLGGAKLEKLKFNSTDISTDSNNNNIVFTPGTSKNLVINAPTALKLPTGANTSRPTMSLADWRFSTTDNVFSGFSTAKRTFGGVYSDNRLTYAKAHPTNNTINFVANSVSTLEVLTDRLRLNGLLINNNNFINGNTISSNMVNTDLSILSNGTGSPIINQIKFANGMLVNQSSSSPLTLKSTADGHIKFPGTYGIVIPAGTVAQQPADPEIGDLRFNTDEVAAEIYNGTEYIPITGTGDVATADLVEELGDLWSLILG